MLFKPVMLTPSNNNILRVAPEVGQRLKPQHIAVSIYGAGHRSVEGGLVINSIPVGEHSKLDPVSLLGDLGDAVLLGERFLSWPQNFEKQVFSCAIADFQDGVAGAEPLPQLVTDMVGCSAFAGCPADRACTPRPDQQSSVDMLVSADLAEFVGEQRNRHWNLDDPVRVCSRQPDLAIADCTLYELLCRLRDQDWQWHRWTGSRA